MRERENRDSVIDNNAFMPKIGRGAAPRSDDLAGISACALHFIWKDLLIALAISRSIGIAK